MAGDAEGEEKPKQPDRLERQVNGMDLDEMLDDLPKVCDHGAKKNAKGFLEAWRGYKLHIDTADCGVPLSAILTSASVHDSQVAIPLAVMTAGRVTNLYDLMDAAYDARGIHQMSERLGHVPIIDVNPPPGQGSQGGAGPGSPGPAGGRLCRSRKLAVPDPFRCREDQRPSQG